MVIPDSSYKACAGTKIIQANTWTPNANPTTAGADDGAMGMFRGVRLGEVRDGTSNTILLGEYGRGPDGLGQGSWFAGFDWFARRVASAGINRPYATPLLFSSGLIDILNAPRHGPGNSLGFGSWHPGGGEFRLLRRVREVPQGFRRPASPLGPEHSGRW